MITLIIIGIVSFLSGFVIGTFKEPEKVKKEPVKFEVSEDELKYQNENFLNYDGTEQL